MTTQLLTGSCACFFDAVGTLLVPDPPPAEAYSHVARRHGLNVSANDLRPRFAAAFSGEEEFDHRQGWKTSEAREVERWRRIVAAVLNCEDEEIFADLWVHFSRAASWRLLPGCGQAIGRLATAGFRLGIASNIDSRLHAIMAEFVELTPLSLRIVSSETGWRKPSPNFFDAVITMAGRPADRITFVGDDFLNDYVGATRAGMRAILLDPEGKAGTGIRAIRCLSELVAPSTTS